MDIFAIANMDPLIKQQMEEQPPFSYYRLVDADTYVVYDYHEGQLTSLPEHCYDTWNRTTPCHNCVSRLATKRNAPVIKLETLDDTIFLIVSSPVQVEGRTFALELAREVTNDLLINDTAKQENIAVTDLIKKINDMSIRDFATGLYNKAFAEEELERLVGGWSCANPLTIAVCDIDKFKDINDNYGHIEGDNVIARLAEMLTECAEEGSGWAARLGGDEFMLCFPGQGKQAAAKIIEEFRDRFNSETFGWKGPRFHTSISVGIVAYDPKIDGWLEFLDQADQYMYSKK
ncbi:MAG: GGDEF domain-containing protein [Raoultibacter sp.]